MFGVVFWPLRFGSTDVRRVSVCRQPVRVVRQFQRRAQGRHDHQGRSRGARTTSVRCFVASGRQERVQPAAETGRAFYAVLQEEPQDSGTHVQAAPATHVRRVPQKAESGQFLQVSNI